MRDQAWSAKWPLLGIIGSVAIGALTIALLVKYGEPPTEAALIAKYGGPPAAISDDSNCLPAATSPQLVKDPEYMWSMVEAAHRIGGFAYYHEGRYCLAFARK